MHFLPSARRRPHWLASRQLARTDSSSATVVRAALASGGLASLASTAALMLCASAEHKGILRPTNATSHWLNGDGAAMSAHADVRRTGVGYLTHHAATVFWALLFETVVAARRGRPTARTLVGDALAVSAVAAAVDYGATPQRFTPGWELVLTKRSMGAVYLAMAAGLAGAAVLRRNRGR